MSRRRALTLGIAAVFAATGLVWLPATGQSVVRAADVVTTTTIDTGPQPIITGFPGGIVATVLPVPSVSGKMVLVSVDGPPTEVSSGWTDLADGSVQLPISAMPDAGTYHFRAAFEGSVGSLASESEDVAIEFARRPLTIGLSADDTSPDLQQTIHLTATLSESGPASVTYWDDPESGPPVILGSSPVTHNGSYVSFLTVPPLGLGDHELTAVVEATPVTVAATSPSLAVDVGKLPVNVGVVDCCALYPNEPSTVYTDVRLASDPSTPFIGATGSMSLTIDGIAFDTQPVVAGLASFQVSSYALGVHTLDVAYTGDETLASGEAHTTLTIGPNSVLATGVGRNYATFYPVKDKYRDAVTVKGSRHELISASIKIYSPKKKLVRSSAIASGVGAYGYAWNGRTKSGKVLAAGKYKIVQVLTDALGAKKTYTSYVTLSHKRIVTRTVTLTKTVAKASKQTSSWVGWKFTLPKATVYKGLRAYVRGRSVEVPGGDFGGHDVTACPITAWNPGCATRIGDLGYTLKWYSKKLSASKDRSGRTVKIYAWADYGGRAGVTHARLKISYGVLR